jgi:hypothetical protein
MSRLLANFVPQRARSKKARFLKGFLRIAARLRCGNFVSLFKLNRARKR